MLLNILKSRNKVLHTFSFVSTNVLKPNNLGLPFTKHHLSWELIKTFLVLSTLSHTQWRIAAYRFTNFPTLSLDHTFRPTLSHFDMYLLS